MMRSVVILTNIIFDIVYEMEDLQNKKNQYYPNYQCVTVQEHAWVKAPSKMRASSVDLNAAEYPKFGVLAFLL